MCIEFSSGINTERSKRKATHGQCTHPILLALHSVINGQVISLGLCPPRSSDLSPSGFLLCEFSQKLYIQITHKDWMLHAKIQSTVGDISSDILRKLVR